MDLGRFPIPEFRPHPLLRSGHLQTIATAFVTKSAALPHSEAMLVSVDRIGEALESRVRCDCSWQTESRRTALIVHGLGGSSMSPIALGMGQRLWRAGYHVVRYNMRNCGGSEALASTLYHSGMHGDVHAVLAELLRRGHRHIVLVGFSAGGNLVLNSAAAFGDDAPAELKAVVAVSGAMDVATAADELHRPANRIYEKIFVGELVELLRRKVAQYPQIFRAEDVRPYKSIREYDNCVTGPYAGYPDAASIYAAISSSRWAERIRVPTLVLHAADDPFIRLLPATREKLAANPFTRLIEPRHGGHCGFIGPKWERWSERLAEEFFEWAAGC